jgi:hypothetical protein
MDWKCLVAGASDRCASLAVRSEQSGNERAQSRDARNPGRESKQCQRQPGADDRRALITPGGSQILPRCRSVCGDRFSGVHGNGIQIGIAGEAMDGNKKGPRKTEVLPCWQWPLT